MWCCQRSLLCLSWSLWVDPRLCASSFFRSLIPFFQKTHRVSQVVRQVNHVDLPADSAELELVLRWWFGLPRWYGRWIVVVTIAASIITESWTVTKHILQRMHFSPWNSGQKRWRDQLAAGQLLQLYSSFRCGATCALSSVFPILLLTLSLSL